MGFLRFGADKVPPLVPIPPIAELPTAKLQASGRYLGTFEADGTRVIGQSLSARSAVRLSLSAEALDVVRIAGSFRILPAALRGAKTSNQFAGKAYTDLLIVRWTHEGNEWETGFRLDAARSVRDAAKAQLGKNKSTTQPEVGAWVRSLSKLARESSRGNE